MHKQFATFVALFFMSTDTYAAAAAEPLPVVEIVGKRRSLEEKSFQDMRRASTLFEEYQARNPDAVMRFRVSPRRVGDDASSLKLRVVSKDGNVPIDIASDLSFQLPNSTGILDSEAAVRSNMPDGSLVWWVQISRNGASSRKRILGDLRMECQLDLMAAQLTRGIKSPAYYAIRAIQNPCLNSSIRYGTYAERPLFSVHLMHGHRRESLFSDFLYGGDTPSVMHPMLDWPYLLRDRFFTVPIADVSWPDDTIVEIDYVEDFDSMEGKSQ